MRHQFLILVAKLGPTHLCFMIYTATDGRFIFVSNGQLLETRLQNSNSHDRTGIKTRMLDV